MSEAAATGVRGYWVTWAGLLVLTVVMLWFDGAAVSRGWLLTILLAAMTAKAALIAGHFMHLRREHAGLILTVVAGLFVMALILFALIAPDALRIRDMMQNP
jgi:caa(3)-type oxidase subunit IV